MRKLQGINTACVVLLVWSYNGYDIYIVGVLSWNLQCVKKACHAVFFRPQLCFQDESRGALAALYRASCSLIFAVLASPLKHSSFCTVL